MTSRWCHRRERKKYFRIVEETQKEIEIRIIISYYSIFILIIWLTYLRKKLRAFLSYIIVNHWIEAEKKETENNLKNSVIYLNIILYIFLQNINLFLTLNVTQCIQFHLKRTLLIHTPWSFVINFTQSFNASHLLLIQFWHIVVINCWNVFSRRRFY